MPDKEQLIAQVEGGFNEISLNNKKQKKAMTSMSDTDKYCLFWYN